MTYGQWNTYKTGYNHNSYTKVYSDKILFASLSSFNLIQCVVGLLAVFISGFYLDAGEMRLSNCTL